MVQEERHASGTHAEDCDADETDETDETEATDAVEAVEAASLRR